QHSALGSSNDPPAAAVQPRGSGWEGAGVKHFSGAGRGDAHRVSSCVGISTDDVVVRLCHDSHSRVPPPGTLLPTWLSASAWMRVTPGQLSNESRGICVNERRGQASMKPSVWARPMPATVDGQVKSKTPKRGQRQDRKSTRLNASHVSISYAVVCS